ncbi:MAG: N-acetylmuramoyl-L-alanine amidase [Chloroflexales bacterium]|nr:N-acetylmuramoyl-L-alanine amidase [Chloroflexales bacterium]
MTDETLLGQAASEPELPATFFEGLLPFTDADDVGPVQFATPSGVLGGSSSGLYIGKGFIADEFTTYVQSYNFGPKPPTFIVLHHTSLPDTKHARLRHASWDSGEEKLSNAQIYAKRQKQLNGIWNYYRRQLGWDRGPHLFIDERWIWLFTPMYYQGIHAAEGNGTTYNYSIGIEVVGHYDRVTWPPQIEALVGHAVAVLKRQLGSFELKHQRFAGGVSSHRDYNKPSCPGAAITEEYYLRVLREGWDRLNNKGLSRSVP